MNKTEFRIKKQLVDKLCQKHAWKYVSNDQKTYRVSYKDELSIYRIDFYLSKMTVVLLPVGATGIYFKRQNLEMIESILKAPHEFE